MYYSKKKFHPSNDSYTGNKPFLPRFHLLNMTSSYRDNFIAYRTMALFTEGYRVNVVTGLHDKASVAKNTPVVDFLCYPLPLQERTKEFKVRLYYLQHNDFNIEYDVLHNKARIMFPSRECITTRTYEDTPAKPREDCVLPQPRDEEDRRPEYVQLATRLGELRAAVATLKKRKKPTKKEQEKLDTELVRVKAMEAELRRMDLQRERSRRNYQQNREARQVNRLV